jgi:hypothetical protein
MKNIQNICDALASIEEVVVKGQEGNVIAVEFEGVPVMVALTDEDVPRIRFSADVQRVDAIDEGVLDTVMYSLLDLNTEIDPIATAIDSSDPDHLLIQARTSLRDIDLQDEEIVGELRGLIFSLPVIKQAIEESVVVTV